MFSGMSSLCIFGVAAWPPPGPLPPSFQFHHQGSNFAIFLILFALCMMEVVVLRIITDEQARDQDSRSVTSMWSNQGRRCLTSRGSGGSVCPDCGGDEGGGAVPCLCPEFNSEKFERGAWFIQQLQKTISLMPWTLGSEKLEQIDEEAETPDSPGGARGERGELQNVREFLEALSARLAGGPLERTGVGALYDHPAYLPKREPASLTSSGGASGAHAQLKRLVARVVEEAAALPALARYAAEPATPADATYEDLLATAILNKVIERYQTENGSGGRSSGIHSASASPTPSSRSSPRSLHSHARDISPPLREEDEEISDWEEGEATVSDDAIELPRRVPFPEFGGDIVHNTDNADREFDEISGSDIQAVDGTWEENWLFQKKKIKSLQSVPVPMLVPNSNTEYRALIGDRDADDTTDLSDNASDADEELEFKSGMKTVLDSKHVIGGKPKVEELLDYEPDSLTIVDEANDYETEDKENGLVDALNQEMFDSKKDTAGTVNKVDGDESILVFGINSGPIPQTEFNLKEEIHRTILNGNAEEHMDLLDLKINGEAEKDTVDGISVTNGSTLSRHEREGEYEETVTRPVQRYADSLRRKHFEEPQEIPTRDIDIEEDLIPGSIAYRERKKWENAVEMPNNPYSPEAIQKRLTAKSTSSLFDMIANSKDMDDNMSVKSEMITKRDKTHEVPVKDAGSHSLQTHSMVNVTMNGARTKSPSPRILKDVLAEEVPQYKRYGRDYYIREAKKSSGGRHKSSSDVSSLSLSTNRSTSLDHLEAELPSPGLLIQQFNSIASNQQYTKFAENDERPAPITISNNNNNKTDILIEYDDPNEQTLFSAKPAVVDDDTDRKFDEILQAAYNNDTQNDSDNTIEPKSPTTDMDTSYVSSSSMEDSIKIYNVPTGEIVRSKADKVSSRYEPAPDSNDNIDMPDKNISAPVSQNGDAGEESLVIVDNLDSLKEDGESLDNISELEDILPQLPNVKELAKKFVSMENLNEPIKPSQEPIKRKKSKENILNGDFKADKPKAMYMHSLTARSISRQFREELKLSMATPLTVPGGSKEIPEGEEVTKESSRPGSPQPPPGTIKSKLAFFESLKSKFSNSK